MRFKTTKWSRQEIQALKQLREEQIRNNIVNWKAISKTLNKQFNNTNIDRTPKRCRDKYVNCISILKDNNTENLWSHQSITLLKNLYLEHGGRWSYFSKFIPSQSQNSIKNKFNVTVRRFCKSMTAIEQKKTIKFYTVIAMLDFSNQIKKLIQKHKLTVNNQSKLFQFRTKMINFCFQHQHLDQQQIICLTNCIKQLNHKIKCFGFFKVKTRKKLKCTVNTLRRLCAVDNVILEQFPNSLLKKLNQTESNEPVKKEEGNIQAKVLYKNIDEDQCLGEKYKSMGSQYAQFFKQQPLQLQPLVWLKIQQVIKKQQDIRQYQVWLR